VTSNERSSTQHEAKLRAARRALELVEPGMTLGLGSGSTASLWIELLGEKVRDSGLKVRAIASSQDSEALARSYGIPLITFEEHGTLDLVIDGADEVAPGLALIKGGGGKLLREKIVASAARRFVVVVDDSKVVEHLGKFPLPVEVISMALPLVARKLSELGFTPVLRKNKDGSRYVTDEGNVLLDCSGVRIEDPSAMAAKLDTMVGVVEHGLFLGMAELALIAGATEVVERKI
jgi:ribose 5-phosphate isomerase A